MMDAQFPLGMLSCIERFLHDVHPMLEPGRDIYPELFDTELFFPLQRQEELKAMMRIARKVGAEPCLACDLGLREGYEVCRGTGYDGGPRVVCEIGADKGAGLYHWLTCLPTVRCLIACEVRGTPYRDLFERAFPRVDFLWLEKSSQECAGEINDFLGDRCQIDVAFIDGDKHRYEQDFDLLLPFMNKAGVAFFHDVHEPASEMRRAWQRVTARGWRSGEILDVSDSMAALERERAGIPPASAHEAWLRHWRGFSCGVGVVHLGGNP